MADDTYIDCVDALRRLDLACRKAGSIAEFARGVGVSASFISAVLNAQRSPSATVLRAIGLRAVTRYLPLKGSTYVQARS